MLEKLKKIFIKDNKKSQNIKKSNSVEETVAGRFLKLGNKDCALIMHEDDQCEVVFTKLYNSENQNFTNNEEFLMALAIFLKQPGFGDMLVAEFRRVAIKNTKMFEDLESKRKSKGESK